MERKLIAILDEVQVQKESGPPSGTPSRAGLRYLDTTTGTMYLSQPVFDAVIGSNIAFPVVSDVRKISFKFWHNEPSPAGTRQFHNATGSPPTRVALTRSATTGVIGTSGLGASQITLDGAVITSGTTNPSAGVWHQIVLDYASDGIIDRIYNANYVGRIADFQISNAVGLVRVYAINEGAGTTIYDSSGNGQSGTLTLGSGNWQLDWVPL